jgi:hypothetical protein
MAEAISNGSLMVVGAYYDLDTGVVDLMRHRTSQA